MVKLHVDVSVEFFKFGAKHCLALIGVLLFLAAKTVGKRARLRIEFRFDHVEGDFRFLVSRAFHSILGGLKNKTMLRIIQTAFQRGQHLS